MRVGTLLRQARERAGISQRVLAQKAGTSRSRVSSYENEGVSPTVETLDRLLAACGLQARVTLEPLLADVDTRVDAMVNGTCDLEPLGPAETLINLIRTLDDHPEATYLSFGRKPMRLGPVRWAFDGAVALQLHGLAAALDLIEVVVLADDATRSWLMAISAQGYARGQVVDWREDDWSLLREATDGVLFSLLSLLRVRIVDETPQSVLISVPWHDEPVPVATVDEVERGHPAHEEVLKRWRTRRSLAS